MKRKGKLQCQEDLFSALERLKSGNTNIVRAPYSINPNTVCKEAVRNRTTIKTSDDFDEIRAAIKKASRSHSAPERRLRKKVSALEEACARFKGENRRYADLLESAGNMIFRLHRQLHTVEQLNLRLTSKINKLRESDKTLDRIVRKSGLDVLLSNDRKRLDSERI